MNGEYQVQKAYDLLIGEDACRSRHLQAHVGWWRSFWKIKVPVKISNLFGNC